jgi:curved DNA-binding protein CbpA
MNLYDCLGVSRDADREAIEAAYHDAVASLPTSGFRRWIATLTGRSPEQLAQARAVLCDDSARREYDERLESAEQIVWMAPGH